MSPTLVLVFGEGVSPTLASQFREGVSPTLNNLEKDHRFISEKYYLIG